MMMRVLIVDDEPPARVRLRQLLAETTDVHIVGEAADAIEARQAIADLRPDIVFLDIEMPQMSGTALASSLAEPRPFVVFATAFDHYALEAFSVDATDYLVKPISRARLAATLARVRERLSRRSDLERDLRAASAAQAALLPRQMPAMPGFDAAALTLPARGVGGDFFVAQQIAADRFVLALGDVAGKGLPAGLVASSLQARLEAVARFAAGSASDVVADVNRALCSTSEGARFATLAYLELDTASGHITAVNAGHLPILVIGPDGRTAHFPSTAPALGLLPDATFPAQAVPVDVESTLLIYSDGVSEAFDAAGVEFGDEAVAAIVRQSHASAAALCQHVADAVRQHLAGVGGHDDITVLALRVLADGGARRGTPQ